jgi:hypothetical protein
VIWWNETLFAMATPAVASIASTIRMIPIIMIRFFMFFTPLFSGTNLTDTTFFIP